MKCVVAGPNVKILGKAVHTLAKLGDELYFEPLEEGLAVRTVNSSRSAYAGFSFAPSFFLEYENLLAPSSSGDSSPHFKAKLAVRSVLFVFKRLADIDKTVERCVIKADLAESRVIFQLHCKYGIVKTHKLAFIESETLVVNHDKSKVPNFIKSHPLVFLDAVACFHNNVDEITFEPLFDQMLVRNHSDDPDPTKILSVKFALNPEEFDVYVVKQKTQEEADQKSRHDSSNLNCITFCLKELRAVLSFAETYASSVGIYFDVAGEPIVFHIDSDPAYEANFVLATCAPDPNEAPCPHPPSPLTTAARHPSRRQAPPPKRAVLTQHSQERPNASVNRSRAQNDITNDDDNPDASRSDSNASVLRGDHSVSKESASTLLHSADADRKRQATLRKLMAEDDDDEEETSNAPPPNPAVSHSSAGTSRVKPLLLAEVEDSDPEEEVPTTPPSKKFRSIFGWSSQISQNSVKTLTSQSVLSKNTNVLAEDSEEDD